MYVSEKIVISFFLLHLGKISDYMQELSDAMLWKALKNGELKAFSTIYKAYYPRLYAYGLKISKTPITTEDTLQDFFVYVYEHRENLSSLETIAPYLFSSYRRLLIKTLKKNSKLISFDELKSTVVDIQFSPEELLIQQESETFKNKNLSALLNKLPKRQKEAIYLKYHVGLNTNDIATIMDLNYQSASNTIHKAIKNLRANVALSALINS